VISISEFVKRVLPDVLGCPTPMVENAIRDSITKFCTKTWILSKGMVQSVVQSDIDTSLNNSIEIDLGELVASTRKPVGISGFLVNSVAWELEKREVVNHADHVASESTKKFYYFPDYQTALVYPITAACDIYLDVAVAPLGSATTFEDILFDDWLDPILAGARERLFKMPGKTWTNFELVPENQREFRRGVVSARNKVGKNATNQSSMVYPRSFG